MSERGLTICLWIIALGLVFHTISVMALVLFP